MESQDSRTWAGRALTKPLPTPPEHQAGQRNEPSSASWTTRVKRQGRARPLVKSTRKPTHVPQLHLYTLVHAHASIDSNGRSKRRITIARDTRNLDAHPVQNPTGLLGHFLAPVIYSRFGRVCAQNTSVWRQIWGWRRESCGSVGEIYPSGLCTTVRVGKVARSS